MGNDALSRTSEGMLRDLKFRIDDLEARLTLSGRSPLGRMGKQVTDWNDAVDSGFYWSDANAANRPPNGSFSSAIVYRNNMAGFERVIQDAVKPTTTQDEASVEWRRVGYISGGNWVFMPWQPLSGVRGTTANRTTYFGTPTTDAQRVALANRRVRYFNTDYQWEEQYYAVTGLSGLTVPGLESGTASGWYPVSQGPKIVLNPGAQINLGAGSNVSGWSTTEWHRGDPANLVYSGGIVTVAMPGRYRVRWRTGIQQGAGALDMWLYAGSAFANDAWELNGSLYKTVGFEFSDVPLSAGDTTRAYINNNGPVNLHVSSSTRRGEYVVEYIGPRLVTS